MKNWWEPEISDLVDVQQKTNVYARKSHIRTRISRFIPPKANLQIAGKQFLRRSIPYSTCFWKPEKTCPNVIGVASWQCVLPILTISANILLFLCNALLSNSRPGIVVSVITFATAICMAVGKLSFCHDICDIERNSERRKIVGKKC